MPFASYVLKGTEKISYLINFLMFPDSPSLSSGAYIYKGKGNSLIKHKHKTLLVASISSRFCFLLCAVGVLPRDVKIGQ